MTFEQFARADLVHWIGFMTKWVLKGRNTPNKFVVKYEDITRDMDAALALIRFLRLNRDGACFMSDLEKHYKEQAGRPLKDITSYSFYDEALFAHLENAIDSEIWHVSGLEKRFAVQPRSKVLAASSLPNQS